MKTISKVLPWFGVALVTPFSHAQLLTNQENGFFSAAEWQAMLPSLNLNAVGSNNGTVPLPAIPAFQSSSFLLNAPFNPSYSGVIDVVWFSETAGRSTNDVFLTHTKPGGTTQIVNNAQSPGNPAFGTSQLYTVNAGFEFLINPLGSPASQFGLIYDGLEGTRFKWASVTFSPATTSQFNYYLFGVEDRVQNGDADFTDLVFGFGILTYSEPVTVVPEPATYGAIGVALVAGLALRRRLTAKAA